MGPIALFDKSFLQSLSVDESVWFDHFFLPIVCPIFYVETLADLAKTTSKRPVEATVRAIAEKFPEMSGSPCGDHRTLAVNDLLGLHIPMDGRVPRSGGRPVKSGTVYDQTPDEAAFHRWQKGEFAQVERLAAARWRRELGELDLNLIAAQIRPLGISGQSCRTLEVCRNLATSIVSSARPFQILRCAVSFFGVPTDLHPLVIKAWEADGERPLAEYAPYAAFVLSIELFFQIALAANLISAERASNRTDIAYLYYLPFCMVFVSSDRLHERCAHLFLRDAQQFVWGEALKADLKVINEQFLQLPEAEREKGVIGWSNYPTGDRLVSKIWDRHMSSHYRKRDNVKLDPMKEKELVERINKFTESPTVAEGARAKADDEMISIQRQVRRKRGSWWQVSKDLAEPNH